MSLSVQFQNALEQVNVLKKPTETIKEYLNNHPTLYKIALLVNHIFRASAMAFFMLALPFSFPVNLALCFSASLFYRLTVEGNCSYKFALPAFAGAVAMPFAQAAISQAASIATIGLLLPLTAYVVYIVLTVNYDVDQSCQAFTPKKSCCKKVL
jgi:hypothetical protein